MAVGAAVWYSVVLEHAFMAVHWRSVVVVAALDCHWLAAHTVCDRHVRSVVAVGAAVSYSSPSHTVLSWHTRSSSALPSRVWCCVALHVVCAWHARLEVLVLATVCHCELLQVVSAEHARLECDVGAVLSYCVLKSHTASALHPRSLSHSPSEEIHWPALCGAVGTLHVVWSLHERSDVCVLATVCHCVALHAVSAVHARLLVTVGAVLWY